MSHDYPISPDMVASDTSSCGYCSLPMPTEEIHSDGGVEFCSVTCQTSHAEGQTLPDYAEETFFQTEVSALDMSMPQGMPRDTLNLISGEPGTRMHAVLLELAWRTLQRGNPAVVVCISHPPLATLRQFLSLKWNVIPHLEEGRLRLIDCYTHREAGSESDAACGAWNGHLQTVLDETDAVSYVHDPTQPSQFNQHLRRNAKELGMNCCGTVIFDSLTELGTLIREIQGYELLKNLRADFAKNRSITVFCGGHYGGDTDEFPHQLEYLFDGIVDLALNPKLIPGMLVKDLTVRKMSGAMTIREQIPYEFIEHVGLSPINPDVDSGADSDEKSHDGDNCRSDGASGSEQSPDDSGETQTEQSLKDPDEDTGDSDSQ